MEKILFAKSTKKGASGSAKNGPNENSILREAQIPLPWLAWRIPLPTKRKRRRKRNWHQS